MTRDRRAAAVVRVRRAGLRLATSLGLGLSLGMGVDAGAWGQMHKVEKPENVVRAVGVYEWTGDLAKPGASRLVPVTVFIDGELQDAGVYQPRPIPFALLPGNAYVVQQAGVAKGLVSLTAAGRLPDTSGTFDDPWFGYGSFEPEAEVKAAALKQSRRLSAITPAKDDDGRAHFSKDSGGPDGGNRADPDRPTLRRRSTTGKADGGSGAGNGAGTGSGTEASATPPDDPDRPVLKRHGTSTAEAKAGGTGATDGGADREVATEALNNDPDRPVLHRGRPTGAQAISEEDAAKAEAATSAKLSGAAVSGPAGLHQMVAVSDAANRPEHDFLRPWADANEHAAVLAKMEALARAKLLAYGPGPGAVSPAGATAAGAGETAAGVAVAGVSVAGTSAAGASVHRAGTTPAARRRAAMAAAAAKKKVAVAPQVVLLDGDLKGYTLSYGGAPTFVYTAHTAGTGAALRYVTVVAQQDVTGQIVPAFGSVTDAAHLDRTPWMRLVGVVDVEASNRASLLFEMREQGSRQFALYRVLGDRSEPLFTTGTTQ